MDLTVRIGALELANPVIIASGPPGINAAAIKRMAAAGPGAVVTKSIDLKPSPGQRLSLSYAGHGRRTLVLTDLWSTYSPEEWCERELSIAKDGDVPVIVSLQAVSHTPAGDIARMSCMAVEAAAGVCRFVRSRQSTTEMATFTFHPTNASPVRFVRRTVPGTRSRQWWANLESRLRPVQLKPRLGHLTLSRRSS